MVEFTVHDRKDRALIGTAGPLEIRYAHRTAEFAIFSANVADQASAPDERQRDR